MKIESKNAASKFGIDVELIEKNADTNRNIDVLGNDLTFINIREKDRTKYVHRLHPYLGKFIPQLVEVFLRKYFDTGDTVLDPFAGSGTTLVEANILGINSVGIELSPFNVMIQKVKTGRYNLELLEKEIKDAIARLKRFSNYNFGQNLTGELFGINNTHFEKTDSGYLNRWFSERALQEMLYFRSIISDYSYEDVLKVVLSRSARSARLIPHYDLARPSKPVREPYWCIKHKRICKPVDECLKFINRYGLDTLKRINDFNQIRSDATITVLQGDSRRIDLGNGLGIDGIFTSPPYVGIIDYHEQHRYAYELFNIPREDEKEIGPASNGQSIKARKNYMKGIIDVLLNIKPRLKKGGKILIVANDKHEMYSDIGEEVGFELIDVFHRPVLMRTERDKNKYFESIFFFRKES